MMAFRLVRQRMAGLASRFCALGTAALLIMEPAGVLHGQTAGAAPPRSLQIMILDGEGALNNIQERTAREPIVQVQDENHKPVAGALVLFSIRGSDSGAGGTFANGASQLSVTTGPDGNAVAHGLAFNHNSGAWQIGVTASDGTLTASTVINEINYAPLPPQNQNATEGIGALHPAPWFLSKPILLIGGGIIIGSIVTFVILDPPANTGTVIVPGGSTVGAPTPAIHLRIRR